ncbi:cysteine--tRNA ligase [Roseibium litorale]|uniref:Cysteine--tRNA ligase n=1 Tax=Roseibium litorale TaxID=2803841 RepID=A0ABR9CPN4_9HYPH|nr:cysteine--tRNA ligase [Roseibium litorale]MBD8892802.1 cysteine--tRNA ligase [Roseibium litorale]
MSATAPASKGLKLTNTLTRSKDEFVPIDPENVRMYVCGPTVYDFAHIGNARPVIVFDVLYRLLRHLYGADHVTYVRNITDVDDKINARALRDYPDLPLNEAIAKVTEKTANQFHADVKALGCLEPGFEPRATQHIGGMIEMIQTLISRGHAYEAEGEVLFDTASMPAYGGLSKRNLDDQKAGARIAVDAHKKNPGDFVLWKLSSGDEPGWDSPWGRGRPGWHIECSVMSEHHLGKVFDIHGGGLDLIFPHHENEIAQSCCAHGTDKMANVWLHNGFVQVEGRKMSKSEGNFVTIHDLLETEVFGGRKWPGEVLRLAMLMTHYREPIDFSVKRLEEAERLLAKWPAVEASNAEPSAEVLAALGDDLNTPAAIQALHALAGEAARDESKLAVYCATAALLGVAPVIVDTGDLDVASIDARIAERLAFFEAKNWAEADRIRDELVAEGIQLMDSKDKTTGKRVTTWEVKR